MGLDMYLYAKNSFVDKEWQDEERNAIHRKLKETLDCDDFICKNNLGSIVTSIEVAYWRKANAIHAWFVRECQGEVDDCRSAYVSREKLNELLEVCRIVNADHKEADNLLPTQSGFFFGSTEYDEWYFGDIEETVKQLESALKNTPENWWFEYQSSW